MAERIPLHQWKILRSVLIFGLLLPALLTGTSHGQHSEETARQRIWLRPYAMFSNVNHPDPRGGTRNNGATLGGDIDVYRPLPHTQVGLDARYTFASGDVSTHHFIGGGPRVTVNVGRFRPYGDFLLGRGTSVFKHPDDPNYRRDQTGALTYGGGFDYQVTRTWALRADLQRERWRFSTRTPYFYPVAASVGVSYQFRFHSRTGPGL